MPKKLIRWLTYLFLSAIQVSAQNSSGELHLRVTDPSGAGLSSRVRLVSQSNDYRTSLNTNESGELVVRNLPHGAYTLQVQCEGFASSNRFFETRSSVPVALQVVLGISSISTSVDVTDAETLIDPHRTGAAHRIGSETIETRTTSLPGRSTQALVNTQPGWLYEGNAVLHPRGSEYQTQFVVDGMPLVDNRSPSFGPEIEADEIQSMSVYTAGIPAEYGRKMGGIIELNTARDKRLGVHGQVVVSGGSFDTAGIFAQVEYGWGKNSLVVSGNGAQTDRYLNPPVVQDFTNAGTTGDFAASFERDLTERDRLTVRVRHALSRFLVPNQQIQQAAGQRQDRDNSEAMGLVSYQHIFSPNVVGNVAVVVRNKANNLFSNPLSTPVIAFQNNSFREGYFKATVSRHHGRQEWKAGVESDAIVLHERFSDAITDFRQFDPDSPASFSFSGDRPDLEQSAFVQDLIRLGRWTVSAGLRWDHYQLLLNQNAFSPRLGISRYFPATGLVVHASYDRVFQTPEFDNILLSSSPAVVSLSDQVLRLPVKPSHGNYYEVGVTQDFFQRAKLDVNFFDRRMNNFADDDQLLNTAVSFPVAFQEATVYGAEGKLELPHWGRLSGFVSYSYMVGAAFLPVTGGLFLGDDAAKALSDRSGRFWVSQDQRHTVRTRFRYQFAQRLWVALGGAYGSGLPFEFTGTREEATAQFGQGIVDRVNFDTGRVKSSLSLNASIGADLWKTDRYKMRLQADAENINNRLNLIDFAGLFSGNAIDTPRSYNVRLTTSF